MTSSTVEKAMVYEMPGSLLRYAGLRPASVTMHRNPAQSSGYSLVATLSDERHDHSRNHVRWVGPPHFAFANIAHSETALGRVVLPAVLGITSFPPLKIKEVLDFFKHFGVLTMASSPELVQLRSVLRSYSNDENRLPEISGAPRYQFVVSGYELAQMQDRLREAWRGERTAIQEIEKHAALEIRVSIEAGSVELVTRSLWSFLCILFVKDRAENKTAICENPDCTKPYFLRGRATQKFCSEPCKKFGHRRDANKYWRDQGNERRKRQLFQKKQAKKVALKAKEHDSKLSHGHVVKTKTGSTNRKKGRGA
jgi:hypothetical protein